MRAPPSRSILLAVVLPSALGALFLAGVTGMAGCSAQALDGDYVDPMAAEVDAGAEQDATSPSDAGAADAARRDARTTDATTPHDAGRDSATPHDAQSDAADAEVVDAAVDLDASFDPTGSACATPNAIQARLCGSCGAQKRLCWVGDAGATWLDWGPCLGAKPDAGAPNTSVTVPCEMCGTKVVRYDSQCNASAGFCQPGPGAECERGTNQWASGLSCTSGLGRYRQCKDDCSWQGFGVCTAYQNPNAITVAAVAGDAGTSVATGTFPYLQAPKARRLVGTGNQACPITVAGHPDTMDTAYVWVEVKNPLTQTVVVDLWHGAGDTEMAVYAGSAIPDETDDAARRACIAGTTAADDCPAALVASCGGAGRYSTAGITGVRIPAGASITVWSALKYLPFGTTAPLALSVRTSAIE